MRACARCEAGEEAPLIVLSRKAGKYRAGDVLCLHCRDWERDGQPYPTRLPEGRRYTVTHNRPSQAHIDRRVHP